jgi:hypothetical protein
MADLYEALRPLVDEVAAQRAAAQQPATLQSPGSDPEELTLAIMGLPNVVSNCWRAIATA